VLWVTGFSNKLHLPIFLLGRFETIKYSLKSFAKGIRILNVFIREKTSQNA